MISQTSGLKYPNPAMVEINSLTLVFWVSALARVEAHNSVLVSFAHIELSIYCNTDFLRGKMELDVLIIKWNLT